MKKNIGKYDYSSKPVVTLKGKNFMRPNVEEINPSKDKIEFMQIDVDSDIYNDSYSKFNQIIFLLNYFNILNKRLFTLYVSYLYEK